MLIELHIQDFAIIDDLRLTFAPGFNALTGETGAGKSIIIDAMGLLLGGRADSSVVRAGAHAALAEGLFALPPSLQERLQPLLEKEGLESEEPSSLLISREVRAAGRSLCRVNGRAVNLALLEEISAPLIDIHGQTEHLSLLRPREQQSFLDRFGGLEELRQETAGLYRRLQQVRRELRQLQQDEQQLARRLDQLAYQLEEIRNARLIVGEDEELLQERSRLANVEQLSQLIADALASMHEGAEGAASAIDLLGSAAHALQQAKKLDPALAEEADGAESLVIQLEELARSLTTYAGRLEFNPERLQEVEERLALIHNLKRKYGRDIPEILAFAEKAQGELDNITHSEERISALKEQEEELRHRLGGLAEKLSDARKSAGEELSRRLERELRDLGMESTRFAVQMNRQPAEDGVYVQAETLACDETGIDHLEFMIAPNPGEPLKPLARIASGGETSRLMLALKAVLARADETPTLIFDEIDQGIGGRVARVVGQKLWELTADGSHQVLCVTHLPQIAAFAFQHYHITKQVEGGRTLTRADSLEGKARLEELAMMLGSGSSAGLESAQEILRSAARVMRTRHPA